MCLVNTVRLGACAGNQRLYCSHPTTCRYKYKQLVTHHLSKTFQSPSVFILLYASHHRLIQPGRILVCFITLVLEQHKRDGRLVHQVYKLLKLYDKGVGGGIGSESTVKARPIHLFLSFIQL